MAGSTCGGRGFGPCSYPRGGLKIKQNDHHHHIYIYVCVLNFMLLLTLPFGFISTNGSTSVRPDRLHLFFSQAYWCATKNFHFLTCPQRAVHQSSVCKWFNLVDDNSFWLVILKMIGWEWPKCWKPISSANPCPVVCLKACTKASPVVLRIGSPKKVGPSRPTFYCVR